MVAEMDAYKKKVLEYIIKLVDTLNSKIQSRDIELSFPTGKNNQLNSDFKNEAFAIFTLILDSIQNNCEDKESAFKEFYNALPNTVKHPKYIAGALITYLLNWRNIRKSNFGVIYRREVIRLFDSFSMGGLDKVFPVVLHWVTKIDGYGAIYLPSSKNVSLLDLDFLVKRHLNHYCSVLISAHLTNMNHDILLKKAIELYNHLLNKINFEFRKQAVKQLFCDISPIKEPAYVSSSLLYYLLLREESVEPHRKCTKSKFSEIVRLKRKMFSDSFNVVQSTLERVLNYEKLYLENQTELSLSLFLELLNRNLLTSAKNLTLDKKLTDKAIEAFYCLVDVFGKDNRIDGFTIFYQAFKRQEIGYKHFFPALLFMVYAIDSYDRKLTLPKKIEIAQQLKISYPKFNIGVNFIRNRLKDVAKYEVIRKLSPSDSLSEKEYFRLVTSYVKEYCQAFNDSKHLAKSVIEIYERCLSKVFYKNLPSGSRQPKLIASVFLCVYINYFKGIVLPQKEFVKLLNHTQDYKIRYHGFNDLYSYLSSTYFEAEKEEYKKKLITDRKFHHKGKIYHFKVNISKLENANLEIKKGLTHLITEILKENIPRSFFKEMKGYRASDLILKGDKSVQLIAIKRGKLGTDINIKEHLIDTLKHKVERDERYELCAIARNIIKKFKKEGMTPPDNSFHEPILTKLLEGNGDAIAIEIPIWKELKEEKSFFTGHIDLIMVQGDILFVCDYKKDAYEIYKSLPQIASYGIMLKERIKRHCNLDTFKVKCLSFSSHSALEFDPEILSAEIKDFVQLWQKKKSKLMVTKGSPRRILDDIEKLICVGS